MHERPARPSVATIVTMVIVGAAAWLSFGVLAIADDGGARIGVLPRVALLALALLIAVSAATLSRLSSRAALPLWLCLLVILPWIPLPVPELFLVWTGPAVLFVWGGIALCMVAVAAAERGARLPALFRDARRAPRCAGVLAFVACVSVGLAAKGPPRGDEPHYLLIVQSLLKDGDLEIANNYERRDYLEYWPGPLRPHFSRPASNGDLYSGHAPGVAALVAPAFAIGGYRGAGLWLAVLTALGSMFVWRAGYIFTRDAGAAWFGWSAVVLTAPIVLHGTLVYPDAIAAVMLAAGTLAVVSLRDVCRASRHTGAEAGRPARWPPGHSFLIGVPVALLPWLHTRLAVPAALLGLVLFLRFGTAVRCRAVTWRDVALFATPIVVGLGGWFAFFRVTFGTFNPSAQHGGDVPLAVEHIPLGLVSVLADQEFGLLVNAPVHILWLAGVWSVFQRDRRLATELLVIVAPYVLALSAFPYWYGGASPPARYLVPAVLPLGLALAALWARQDGAAKSLSLCLLGLSVLIAAVLAFGDDGGLAYNQENGRARWLDWSAPLVDLPRAFPSFFRAAGRPLPGAPALVVHLVDPAIVWSIAILAGWIFFRLLVKRAPPTVPVRALVTSCCVLTVLALGASLTWGFAGGTHTTATRSQLRLLRSDDPRQRSFGVRLPDLHAFPTAIARTQLALSTSGLDEPRPDALLDLRDVPSGEYQLRVKRGPSADGELLVGVGRATAAAWRASLSDGSADTLTIRLPLVASSLVVNGDAAAKQSVEAVALLPRPRHEEPTLTSEVRARDAARYGPLVVFAIDDRVLLDSAGFWVLGGRQPDVVVTTDTPVQALALEVRNVAVANRVGVTVARWSVERSLAPDEVWQLRVPVAGLGSSFRIGFDVEAGLPASKGLLGCRVEIR